MLNCRQANRSLFVLASLLAISCSVPSPPDLLQLPPPALDSGQPSIKDIGPIRLLDGGVDAGQPARSIFPNGRALLVDFDMRPSTGWRGLLDTLSNAEISVQYRRWYPHITSDDVDGRYGLLIVAAGTGPGGPSPLMRPSSVESLSQFVQSGGTVLFATTHSWADSPRALNETFRFNETLEALDVRARIESNTLIGDVFLPEEETPPLHGSLPWAYVTPLEWSIGLPVAFPGPDLQGRDELGALALGWSSSISCAGADITVLTRAHIDVYSWDRHQGEETLSVPSESLPVAVLAPAGHGLIGLAPRSVLEMYHHSSVGADQPILEPNLLEQANAMGRAIITTWVETARGESPPIGQGCFNGQMPLYNPSEHYPPDLQLSVRPVPGAAPEPRWLETELRPSVPRTLPSWFRGERCRIGYGELVAGEAMTAVMNRIVTSNMDALTANMPASFLIDYEAGSEISPLIAAAADQANNTNTFLALAVHYRNALYQDSRAEVGPALGAHGQQLDAPAPLSQFWWDRNLSPLLLGAAQAASDHQGLNGLVLDLELYDSGSLVYKDGYAFDDETWTFVSESIAERDPVLGSEAASLILRDRLSWLVDHGLIGFVYQQLENEVARRAQASLDAARAIDPSFEIILYVHAVQTGWFYRGLMRGLGSVERPLAVLTYDQNTTEVMAGLRNEGISVVGLSGILAVRLRARDAETALYQAGLNSDGNWMFQVGDFPDLVDVPPPRHDPIDAYWSAFGRANANLETAE